MTQATESEALPVNMSLLNILIFPCKMLWIGNFLVVLYILLCAGGSIEIARFLQRTLEEFFRDLLPDAPYPSHLILASNAFYLLCIPFMAAAAGLPIRIIWLYGAFFLRPIFSETKGCCQRFISIIGLSYLHPFYALLPLAGILVIRELAVSHDLPSKGVLLISICIGLTGTVALYRLLQWLFLLLLATFVDVNEYYALQNARIIFGYKAFSFITVSLLGFGGSAALYISRVLKHSIYLPYCLGFILWYTLALLIVLALEAGETHAQMNGATLRITPLSGQKA